MDEGRSRERIMAGLLLAVTGALYLLIKLWQTLHPKP